MAHEFCRGCKDLSLSEKCDIRKDGEVIQNGIRVSLFDDNMLCKSCGHKIGVHPLTPTPDTKGWFP